MTTRCEINGCIKGKVFILSYHLIVRYFTLSSAHFHGGFEKSRISGYLLKQSKDGVWQKRFFETNDTFLSYYKSKKMTKLLAALNLTDVGEISLVGNINDNLGDGVIFQLELKNRNYVLRAKDMAEAQRWIKGLIAISNETKSRPSCEKRETQEPQQEVSLSQRAVVEDSYETHESQHDPYQVYVEDLLRQRRILGESSASAVPKRKKSQSDDFAKSAGCCIVS